MSISGLVQDCCILSAEAPKILQYCRSHSCYVSARVMTTESRPSFVLSMGFGVGFAASRAPRPLEWQGCQLISDSAHDAAAEADSWCIITQGWRGHAQSRPAIMCAQKIKQKNCLKLQHRYRTRAVRCPLRGSERDSGVPGVGHFAQRGSCAGVALLGRGRPVALSAPRHGSLAPLRLGCRPEHGGQPPLLDKLNSRNFGC